MGNLHAGGQSGLGHLSLLHRFTNNIYFIPMDEREIINTTLKFTPKLSQGHDNISAEILRDTIHLTAAKFISYFQ